MNKIDSKKNKSIVLYATGLVSGLCIWGITELIKSKNKKVSYSKMNSIEELIKNGKCRYALYELRIIFDECLNKFVSSHLNNECNSDNIFENLQICENKNLIDEKELHKLHLARKICNKNAHERCEESAVNAKFVYGQVKYLMSITNYAQ